MFMFFTIKSHKYSVYFLLDKDKYHGIFIHAVFILYIFLFNIHM